MSSAELKGAAYNRLYGHRRPPIHRKPRGPFSVFLPLIERFSITRTEAVFNLIPRGKRFLDVGCGSGDLVLMAKKRFEEVYGVDISVAMLRIAEEKASLKPDRDRIHFIKHDVEEGLPFPDEFFDAVACVAVLEHLVNPPFVLAEINRVLRRGRYLIVQVPNFAFFPNRLKMLIGKLPTTGYTDDVGVDWLHLHNFTPDVLTRLLLKTGFYPLRLSCSGFMARFRRIWLSFLASDVIVLAKKYRSIPGRLREELRANPLTRFDRVRWLS